MTTTSSENRSNNAIRIKDEQIRIISEQNSSLLENLTNYEQQIKTLTNEKLSAEEENRILRKQNFELQAKTRAINTKLSQIDGDVNDKQQQLVALGQQSTELLRLLETEEAQNAKLLNDNKEIKNELKSLQDNHIKLLSAAKSHEENATNAIKEGQLRAQEISLLRAEIEQLRGQNNELKMKTTVELESLEEQLRVRKEKQYQLLERLQNEEEAKRKAQDRLSGMEEKVRNFHARNIELETQIQVEIRSKLSKEKESENLLNDINNIEKVNNDLQKKITKGEQDKLRMEAETRDNAIQISEMSQKIFQLLERLKLAELGKAKSVEALKRKDQEVQTLQKKNARLIQEVSEEGKLRVKAELDKKVLEDQVRVLKKQNTSLSQKCQHETKLRLREEETRKITEEKLKTVGGRLSFLLKKIENDEENHELQNNEIKKLEKQISILSERSNELQIKLQETGESNKIITQAMKLKQDELDELKTRFEALQEKHEEQQEYYEKRLRSNNMNLDDTMNENDNNNNNNTNNNNNNIKNNNNDENENKEIVTQREVERNNIRKNGGRGRFNVETKKGTKFLILSAKRLGHKEWLNRNKVNQFLLQAQKKGDRFHSLIIEKVGHLCALLMVEEEDKRKIYGDITQKDNQIQLLHRKVNMIQEKIATEEDIKRRMLLRYVHSVKSNLNTKLLKLKLNDSYENLNDIQPISIKLSESIITDEEVHAICALLKNNTTVEELHLRDNQITDEGARGLAAVLGGRSSLQFIDLRNNQISKQGIRAIAEGLERSERIRHVYIHAGGKIEALGAGYEDHKNNTNNNNNNNSDNDSDLMNESSLSKLVTIDTVCIVDVRDNKPDEISLLDKIYINDNNKRLNQTEPIKSSSNKNFTPVRLLSKKKKKKNNLKNRTAPNLFDLQFKKHQSILKKKELLKSQSTTQLNEHPFLHPQVNRVNKNNFQQTALEEGWEGRVGGLNVQGNRPLSSNGRPSSRGSDLIRYSSPLSTLKKNRKKRGKRKNKKKNNNNKNNLGDSFNDSSMEFFSNSNDTNFSNDNNIEEEKFNENNIEMNHNKEDIEINPEEENQYNLEN